MVAPGMGDGKRLKDSANRLAEARGQEEGKMVGHQAVAKEQGGIARRGLSQGFKKGQIVGSDMEDGGAVVAAIEGMVDETIGNRTRLAWHSGSVNRLTALVKKNDLTPFSAAEGWPRCSGAP